jgi:hypothetical protein
MDKWQCFFIQSFDFAKVANLCWENTVYTIHKKMYFKFFARAFHKTAKFHHKRSLAYFAFKEYVSKCKEAQ